MLKRILFLLTVIPFMTFGESPDVDWLRPITLDAQTKEPMRDIPRSDFFEIVVSRESAAEELLKNGPAVSVGSAEIQYFGQSTFHCGDGKAPYLIRAEFMNGATGDFMVRRFGSALLVGYGSLGPSSAVKRTALVVCLDFQPAKVFSGLSGAL